MKLSELMQQFYVMSLDVGRSGRYEGMKGALMERGYVYILTKNRLTVLYVGCTNDLKKRLVHHKHRLIRGFTERYNVHRLVYLSRRSRR